MGEPTYQYHYIQRLTGQIVKPTTLPPHWGILILGVNEISVSRANNEHICGEVYMAFRPENPRDPLSSDSSPSATVRRNVQGRICHPSTFALTRIVCVDDCRPVSLEQVWYAPDVENSVPTACGHVLSSLSMQHDSRERSTIDIWSRNT